MSYVFSINHISLKKVITVAIRNCLPSYHYYERVDDDTTHTLADTHAPAAKRTRRDIKRELLMPPFTNTEVK